MPSIFISYRRGPTSDITYRIRDEIARALGGDRVFIDIDSISPGEPFKHAIERTLSTCEVVLAIVGPDWCSERLAQADDVLRRELEIALAKPLTLVLPVLVQGAALPPASSVPEILRPLFERQAISIASGADFNIHVARCRRHWLSLATRTQLLMAYSVHRQKTRLRNFK